MTRSNRRRGSKPARSAWLDRCLINRRPKSLASRLPRSQSCRAGEAARNFSCSPASMCHPERSKGSALDFFATAPDRRPVAVTVAGAKPVGVKGRSSAPLAAAKSRPYASLAAALAFRCHPEPIRAERGWVRDLLLLSLSGIPARQSFRTPASRPLGTPISRLASCLTFVPWSSLRRKCSSRRLATVVGVSPLQVPHPSLVRVGLSFDSASASAFAFRCHPEERSDEVRFSIARPSRDESLFVRQFEQHNRNPPSPLGGQSVNSDIKSRRAAPTARGAFPASLLSSFFSHIRSQICNSQPIPAITQREPS